MDDSDLDFVDLCSKLLKRVRKKPAQTESSRSSEPEPRVLGVSDGAKRKRKNCGSKVSRTGTSKVSGDAGSVSSTATTAAGAGPDPGLGPDLGLRAKDQVLLRMQKFRKPVPQKMERTEKNQNQTQVQSTDSSSVPQPQEPCSSEVQADGDEVLALRLQQQMDLEAAEAQMLDLEDGGLFFCQICQRNLSHMSPEGRTQHLNRCLDESEEKLLTPPPAPPPDVPDCPLCGQRFRALKSRSAHLKRCSAERGVSSAQLLQLLQREARRNQQDPSSLSQGVKRKAELLKKKNLKKKKTSPEVLDEDTMLALALSSSLLHNTEPEAALPWKPHPPTAKGGVRKRKAVAPPLLLVQDAVAATLKLQERVSALLLRGRAPSPPTPTRCPSTLGGHGGSASLWQKSALLSGSGADFYSPDLDHFIRPCGAEEPPPAPPSSSSSRPPPQSEDTPPSPSSSPPESSHVLQDLMELAEDGLTLTQCGHTTAAVDAQLQQHKDRTSVSVLRLSGFVPEPSAEGCVREAGHAHNPKKPRPQPEPSVVLSRLTSDLRSMVNNPQLSDLQLQVDSGEVFYCHRFMVYARCPLLAHMVHESGFLVEEDGAPAAQRVLLPNVSGPAVLVLLQYLYTAQCCITASVQPEVLELGTRFDLKELQQLCGPDYAHQEEGLPGPADQEEGPSGPAHQEQELQQDTDRAFVELLRSMWNDDEEEDSEAGGKDEDEAVGGTSDDVTTSEGGVGEEHVNEAELEEIYEFAATQRKKEEGEEGEPGQDQGQGQDLSYNHHFSEEQEEDPSSSSSVSLKTPPPEVQIHRPSCRTLLQSSASLLQDSPPGPSLRGSHLPVPGVSPGLRDLSAEAALLLQDCESLKQGLRSSLSWSPDPPPTREEPELIVLSDSSEEVLTPPQPQAPPTAETPVPPTYLPEVQHSPGEGSLEVSWLIPSTPVQSRSSPCRTQLFPGESNSSPSPAPPSPNRPHLWTGEDPRPSPEESGLRGDSKPSVSLKRISSLQGSSEKDTPQQAPPPYSSTPLPPQLQQIQKTSVLLAPSPLSADPEEPGWTGQDESGVSESLEKTELASFCLSPSASPSGPQGEEPNESWSERPGSEGSRRDQDQARGEAGESSFQQSFMDEPPIAFNDSWGFEADPVGFGTGADPAGFSLRLEDSGGSGPKPKERSGSSPSSARPSQTPSSSKSPIRSPAPGTPSTRAQRSPASISSPPSDPHSSIMDPRVWDSWEEEEEALPLAERMKAQLRTPASSRHKTLASKVPVTPMPHFSDMETPELKNKLNRFGVRPLPKRQMILKLKEIHHYTHQLTSSDSEDDLTRTSTRSEFKEPTAPPAGPAGAEQQLSASQGSNTSSTAESERSNPELCPSSDSDSDLAVSSSQSATRLQDRLRAVRSFILSDPDLYGQILEYRPLVLSQLQDRLKAAGIRLGAGKLLDYLDSQCITVTTAKPGQPGLSRHRRGRKTKETGIKRGGRRKAAPGSGSAAL